MTPTNKLRFVERESYSKNDPKPQDGFAPKQSRKDSFDEDVPF